jgi:hypothetical protein
MKYCKYITPDRRQVINGLLATATASSVFGTVEAEPEGLKNTQATYEIQTETNTKATAAVRVENINGKTVKLYSKFVSGEDTIEGESLVNKDDLFPLNTQRPQGEIQTTGFNNHVNETEWDGGRIKRAELSQDGSSLVCVTLKSMSGRQGSRPLWLLPTYIRLSSRIIG